MINFIVDPPYDFRDKDDNHANITHLVKQSQYYYLQSFLSL